MEQDGSQTGQNYTVVARRYRPRAFDELIGQGHVAQALSKAIATGRVGHAYLFTGARGVGKTSTARIFAKALNTQAGTSEELIEEISQAIDSGEDMDTIEIDGASNRGIEEIRQLRANVNVRPSRARFKIYIIDEVHMLTNQAFNALLKTLEEPPSHVKFIFCTTDPDKMPITVLSRCQRFDFAPVKFEAIQKRLGEIATAEGYTADAEALALLARRAAGSMRDSQSLLEQVMSFSSEHITTEQVHALLGTADEGRLLQLLQTMAAGDALNAIGQISDAIQGGTDPGQLAEQLLNLLRDLMAVGVGGGPDVLLLANPASHSELKRLVDQWGVQTVLSAIGLLDETLVRMRASVSATTLLEVAAVQICQLEQIASVPALLELLSQSGLQVSAEKKNVMVSPAVSTSRSDGESTTVEHQEASRGGAVRLAEPVSASVANPQRSPSSAVSGEEASSELPVDTNGGGVVTSSPDAAGSRGVVSHCGVSEPSSSSPSTVELSALEESVLDEDKGSLATAVAEAPQTTSAVGPVAESPNAKAIVARSQPVATNGSSHALEQWLQAVRTIDGMLADFAAMAKVVEPEGADTWRIVFPPGAHRPREYCEAAERRTQLQEAVQTLLGRKIQLRFAVMPGELPRPAAPPPQASTRVQKMREIAENPFVKKLCEILDGEIIKVDSPPGL